MSSLLIYLSSSAMEVSENIIKAVVRKIPTSIICLLISVWLLLSYHPPTQAQEENPQDVMCYAQCGAYKFVWQGDMCFDLIMNTCSIGRGSLALKAIGLLRATWKIVNGGGPSMLLGVSDVFKAWLICKPLIEDCVVPQLEACQNTCSYNNLYYAPNLSVGSPYSHYFRGIFYNEDKNELYFRVANNGLGYAEEIGVQATWGSTPNRDGVVSGGGLLFNETIPELLYLGSRQYTPPGLGGRVADFLIDESNFSDFLSRFKSDADFKYIPPLWEKTVHFVPPANQLTKVFLNVDPSQLITESNEDDNLFILEIDKRPTPAKFEFEDLEVVRGTNSITEYVVSFELKNLGEEPGEAQIDWYEGKYEEGKTPFAHQQSVIPGEDKVHFDRIVTVDVSSGSPYCAPSKRFTVVATDPYGGKREITFTIPLFAGMVSGKVTDLFDEPVAGAVVSLSNGQSTTTDERGHYTIKGISQLGKMTVTVSHPDFTQQETKEIELTFDQGNDLFSYCRVNGLEVTGLNFVLQNMPVVLTIRAKDRAGASLAVNILAVSDHFRHEIAVDGEKVIEDIQPGEYRFAVSAPGYYTLWQTIVLVPPQQEVEFRLEKMAGRENDAGLSLHEPRLLWTKTLGQGNVNELVAEIAGTKDGKLLVLYTYIPGQESSGKLYFLNPRDGTEIAVVDTPSTKGQQEVGLDASYDGRTVGFMINPGGFGLSQEERVVKIFSAAGIEQGNTAIEKHRRSMMEVSPDGFYLYPTQLVNLAMHQYVVDEIMGGEDDNRRMTYLTAEALHFLRNNQLVSRCQDDAACVLMLNKQEARRLGEIEGSSRAIDSSFDGGTIIIRTDDKLYYFGDGCWEKDAKRDPTFTSAAVSVGGEYVIAAVGTDINTGQGLKVYRRDGQEATPKFGYENVRFVEANDRGLFYTTVRGKEINYYQLGSYATEYNPPPGQEAEEGVWSSNDFEVWENGAWHDPGPLHWYGGGFTNWLHRAKKTVTMITPFYGTLMIHKDTIFSDALMNDGSHQLVIVFGQAEIRSETPISMVLLKLPMYDLPTFEEKFFAYRTGQLTEKEYVVVRNLQTDFTVLTKRGTVQVAVKRGEIEASFGGEKTKIEAGKKMVIDPQDKITVKKYTPRLLWYLAFGLLASLLIFVELKYRQTTTVKTLNQLAQKTLVEGSKLLVKTVRLVFHLLGKLLVSFFHFVKNHLKIKQNK